MATIGMDRLYYAKITEASDGEETYGVPAPLAKAMKAELSIELAEAVLFADDGAAEVIKDFKSGTLSLGIDDIGVAAARDLTGAVADDNGVLISASENAGAPVATARVVRASGVRRFRPAWPMARPTRACVRLSIDQGAAARSRRSLRITLPTGDFGRSSRKRTRFGTL